MNAVTGVQMNWIDWPNNGNDLGTESYCIYKAALKWAGKIQEGGGGA